MPRQALPGDAALVIIPGSKSTIADLAALRSNGWDIDILAHLRRGGRVLGLCGGYQMLGRVIHDPGGIEGPPASVPGLGLLDVETTLTANKSLVQVQALHAASQLPISGYEIHLGETLGGDCARPFAMIGNRPDGATSSNGLVEGTYLHGCFASDAFRTAYLGGLGIVSKALAFEQTIEDTLDSLSEHIAASVDLETLLEIAR
jgi:adenosylcobyric acid synthase